MRLKAKCVEETCADYGREQIIDVTGLLRLLDEAGRHVTCPSCRSFMKIIVPFTGSQQEPKRPGPNLPHR